MGKELQGLTNDEVIRSRKAHGQNALTAGKKKGFFRGFLENFGDPMIKILLIALCINLVFLFNRADIFESLGIAIAVFLAVMVSTVSEYGSEAAFERLKQNLLNIRCRVRRSGETAEVSLGEIVVGDIVLLSAGEKIPADGVIISGRVEVDQSALNGESKEAGKYPNDSDAMRASRPTAGAPGCASPTEGGFLNPSLIFSGTVVTSGEGLMQVAAVGNETFYGKIAAEIQEKAPDSSEEALV